jgi:CheY-like chemotaxis protein
MRRVLVIDDNGDLRDLMQVILLGDGHLVDVASSGQEGLAALREAAYDLVVTDIFMPGQDGIETIQQLRAEFPAVKVLAVSGGGKISPSHGYLLTALEIGADAVLPKPFDPAALSGIVRRLLSATAGQ